MNKAMPFWYGDKKMVDAVNLCMEAIRASGLSAYSAENLPACLEQAILVSNHRAAQKTLFEAVPVTVTEENCGYDVSPMELSLVQ